MSSSDLIKFLARQEPAAKKTEIQKLKTSQFSKLFYKQISNAIKPSYLAHICELMDIDKDGYIDKFDFDTFMSKYCRP